MEQSSDALTIPSLSKGEMGKADKFGLLTPPFRCSFSCCHEFSNDSFAEKKLFTKETRKGWAIIHQTAEIIGNQCTGWDGQRVKNSLCSPQYEGGEKNPKKHKKKERKEKKIDYSCQCAVLDFVL